MGLSQSRFARYFNIPVSTIQNWEQGSRTPPPYVVEMMYCIVSLESNMEKCITENVVNVNDMSINFKTVEFINELNELAYKTSVGFMDFKDCKEGDEYEGVIYYDSSRNNHYNDHEKNVKGDYVVADMLIDENHHDVISVYGASSSDYAVRVLEDGLGEKFVAVYIRNEYDDFIEKITVENGIWYYS